MIKIVEGMNEQEINEGIAKLEEQFIIVDRSFSSPRSGYYVFALSVKEKTEEKKTKKKKVTKKKVSKKSKE